jgi:hypothetical protein
MNDADYSSFFLIDRTIMRLYYGDIQIYTFGKRRGSL